MKTSSGYSLMEVMIAIALSTIIGLLAMQLADYLRRQERLARISQTRESLLSSIYALSDRGSVTPTFGDFKPENTYWLPRTSASATQASMPTNLPVGRIRGSSATLKLNKIQSHATPAQPFRLPTDSGTIYLFKDSSTLDLASIESLRDQNTEGFIASRCIPAADATKSNFTLAEVMAYKQRPLLPDPNSTDASMLIVCCPEGATDTSSCSQITAADSPWRLRIFHVSRPYICANGQSPSNGCSATGSNLADRKRIYNTSKVNVRVIPTPSEVKDVSGAGFIASFDSATAPTAISIRLFLADRECLRVTDTKVNPLDKTCKDDTRLYVKLIDRPVITNVHSSGMLQIGH